MPYEKARELAEVSWQKWVSEELFSFGWFLTLFVILFVYTVWVILLKKDRIANFLLLGSLSAVGFLIFDIILFAFYGFVEYPISLTPYKPSLFVVNVTLAPVAIMLAEQYARSWKGYLLWSALGIGLVTFVILPIYSMIGIVWFHNGWNVLIHFLYLYVGSLTARLVFLWVNGIQKRHQVAR